MKIAEVIAGSRKDSLPPLQRDVLQYVERHPDEVFRYQDHGLAKALGIKPSALGFSLWALEKKGFIKRAKVDRVYFGCEEAINELERQLAEKRLKVKIIR